MPNVFKYNPSSTEAKSLRKGNFYIGTGDVGKGPTNETGFWNGVTVGTFSYVIVLHRGDNIPNFYQIQNDAELIERTNQIDKSVVRTTKEECFSYFAGQSDKMIVNRDYDTIVTDGLVLNLDAGFLASFPATGSTWNDISISSSNTSLQNSPTFNSFGIINFDGLNNRGTIPFDFQPTHSCSFEIIFKHTHDFVGSRYFLYGSSGTAFSIWFRGDWAGNLFYFLRRTVGNSWYGDSAWSFTTGIYQSCPSNEFVHLFFTHNADTGEFKSYRNGTLTRTRDGNFNNQTSTVTGYNGLNTTTQSHSLSSQNDGLYLPMQLDTLRVYNRVFSLSEIQQNYYKGPIVTSGLTFSVDSSNIVSYDRVSTSWYNLSGTLYTGALQNGPTFSFNNGGTLYFDGNNDIASFGTGSNFDFVDFTAGIWAKSPTNTSGAVGYPIHVTNLIGKGNWNDNNSWRIGYKSTGSEPATFITFGYGIGWNGGPQLSVGSFDLSNWNYFVGVATTTQQLLYLNGVLVSTVNTSKISVSNTFDLQIGRSSYISRFFTGNVGPSHIYNRALSSSEVLQNFNAHRSRFGI